MKSLNKAKYVNLLFFTLVLLSLAANIFVSLLSTKGIEIHILLNLLVSQGIVLIPGLIAFLLLNKGDEFENPYKRLKLVTIPLLIVFMWLLMPLISAVNVFSQLFTTNEVLGISGDVLALPAWLMILIIGFVGPFCEEFVFRTVIYNGLAKRSERYIASGIVSALFFGLMHMNLNQLCYAFVLGIVFALINEILGSSWPSFVCHATVNTQNVLLLFVANKFLSLYSGKGIDDVYNSSVLEQGGTGNGKTMILIMFFALLFLSIFTTALACLLFYGICHIEGKKDKLKLVFSKNVSETKEKVLYSTGIIGITICIFVMFLLEPLLKMIKK